MWVGLCLGEAGEQQGVGGDSRGGPGQEAREAVGAVAGQFHPVGDLAEGRLDAVAPFGDDFAQGGGHGGALLPAGRDGDGGAAGGLGGGEGPAAEALVREQVTRGGPGGQQVAGDLAFVHGGGHDGPGPDDAGAQVRFDGEPEAVEPLGVRGVAAEPGMQPIRPGPRVRAADPRGVPDRQSAGINLLAVIRRDLSGEVTAQQLRATLAARLPEDDCQQVDTSALPVRHPSRVRGPDGWTGPGNGLAARFGRDAAHAEWFYGFRLAVKTDLGSRIVRAWAVVPAAMNEREIAADLLEA